MSIKYPFLDLGEVNRPYMDEMAEAPYVSSAAADISEAKRWSRLSPGSQR